MRTAEHGSLFTVKTQVNIDIDHAIIGTYRAQFTQALI